MHRVGLVIVAYVLRPSPILLVVCHIAHKSSCPDTPGQRQADSRCHKGKGTDLRLDALSCRTTCLFGKSKEWRRYDCFGSCRCQVKSLYMAVHIPIVKAVLYSSFEASVPPSASSASHTHADRPSAESPYTETRRAGIRSPSQVGVGSSDPEWGSPARLHRSSRPMERAWYMCLPPYRPCETFRARFPWL